MARAEADGTRGSATGRELRTGRHGTSNHRATGADQIGIPNIPDEPAGLWITHDERRADTHSVRGISGATWRQLAGFVLGEQLGSGDSGEVWAARIAATGEQVALKRVALTGPDALRAARTEAALLATLDHPHLVRVHALLPTSDAAVLVLDLADGGSLADVLERRGQLSVGEVVTALAPIGAASPMRTSTA